MLQIIMKGIKRAIAYGIMVGGGIAATGYLGVECLECACGSCIGSSTYSSWINAGFSIGLFVGIIAAIYGFIAGVAQASSDAKEEKINNQKKWVNTVNNEIANIKNLLESGQNANNEIQRCLNYIGQTQLWMDNKFISKNIEPARQKLKNQVFAIDQISMNNEGAGELTKVKNILNARNILQSETNYQKKINNINQLLQYIGNASNVISMYPYGKLTPNFEQNLEKYSQEKNLYEDLLEKETKIFENAVEHAELLTKELLEEIEVCMYQVVREKPYNADKFNKIQAFYDFFKNKYAIQEKYDDIEVITIKAPDSLYNELYTYKSMGESVVNSKKNYIMEQVNNRINYQIQGSTALNIAAALKNLGLFELEKEILINYVGRGIQVSDKIQNRIRYLETDTRNGKIGQIHEIETQGFAYDFASSTWNDDDIQAFFRNLAYQEKKLNYSLVIEDWKKTLPILSKVQLSDEIICSELKKMLQEEYDGEIDCSVTKTIALSESSNEEQQAIVFQSSHEEYNREITFILSCIKVGKNLSIRIFTLFTPSTKTTTEQDLKEALTIKKGLNPKNTAYIEGLKESILETLEKYLKKETTSNDIY